MKTPHKNRRKRQDPKQGKGWCRCDFWYGTNSDKCPVCGVRNGLVRFKKVPPSIEEFD